MSIIEQILLGLALAMDCFSVSFATGTILKQNKTKTMITMALLFGLFQAFMPLIGWLCTLFLENWIKPIDHWIAFGLLCLIGIRMIIDQFRADDNKKFNPASLGVILLMAFATSIDALSVGITFTCMELNTIEMILSPIAIIGICSVLLSLIGNAIGVSLGKRFKFPAELFGGAILIIIGTKVLIDHLTA